MFAGLAVNLGSYSGGPGILEVEIKFGYYNVDGFRSNVPYYHFARLQKYLQDNLGKSIVDDFTINGITHEESTVSAYPNIRKITVAGRADSPDIITWENKTVLQDIDIRAYDIRLSINREVKVEKPVYQLPRPTIRERSRISFILYHKDEPAGKIDMTEVMMTINNTMRQSFEVEMEMLGDDISRFERLTEVLFKILHGTNFLYTVTEKNNMQSAVATMLQKQNVLEGSIMVNGHREKLFVEARNVKRRDIVYGGIVGNPSTSYNLTFKADGIRKLLVIHTTGIWLVYPPEEFNLMVLPSNNKVITIKNVQTPYSKLLSSYNLTVLDGELVGTNLYLAFDVLSNAGNLAVQKEHYSARLRIARAYKTFSVTDFAIDTKETTSLLTPEDFFKYTTEYLHKRKQLSYPEDGLMFIPENAPYNPHSELRPMHDRVLTEVPDTCKWKEPVNITIDFAIEHRQGEIVLLSGAHGRNVPFVGDDINPVTPDMIDHTAALTLNVPSGKVVEYEFINNKFSPRIVRYNKLYPNSLEVALDNWKDINDPVTVETMEGKDLDLVFTYHNRVKKSLYDYAKGKTLLDIGSGKGGDIKKWKNANFTHIVAVEPNSDNRATFVSRRARAQMDNNIYLVPTGGEDTEAITAAVQEFIPRGKVDVVSIMLSLSFFWASSEHLEALVDTIVHNLKPGGKIIFLTIDGDVITQIMEPWNAPHFHNLKLANVTVKLFPPCSGWGRAVEFTIPNSIVNTQLEYLVHLADLTLALQSYGFRLTQRYRAEKEKLLSKDGLIYTSMYSYGVYENVSDEQLLNIGSPKNKILPTIKCPDMSSYVSEMTVFPSSPVDKTLPSPSPNSISMCANPQNVVTAQRYPQFITPGALAPTLAQASAPTNISITSPIAPIGSPVNKPTRNLINITPIGNSVNEPTEETEHNFAQVHTDILTGIPDQPPFLNRVPFQIPSEFQSQREEAERIPMDEPVPVPRPSSPRSENPVTLPPVNIPIPKIVVNSPPLQILHLGPLDTNDDTYAPIVCTWSTNMVRIATLGGGDCLIHSVLKAFYRPYQDSNSTLRRISLARAFRQGLGDLLSYPNLQALPLPKWQQSASGVLPDRQWTIWQSISDSQFPYMTLNEFIDPIELNESRVDYSLSGLKALYNSSAFLGNESYNYIAQIIKCNLYIWEGKRDDLHPHHYAFYKREAPSIFIAGNTQHYEVIGRIVDGRIQTVFTDADTDIMMALDKFYPDRYEISQNTDIVGGMAKTLRDDFTDPTTKKVVIPQTLFTSFAADDPLITLINAAVPILKSMDLI